MIHHEKLLLSVRETAYLLGIGRSKLYELIRAGDLAVVKLSTRTLIHRDEVARFASSLACTPTPCADAGYAWPAVTTAKTPSTHR